ncbi:MAG: TadE/TadG family type IV pilus assembly protein [Gammaproteobacteria bacterium]
MLEFALIFPMLVILLFACAEVGRLLYQQNELTKAVMAGSRFIARSPDALTAACAQGSAWAAATATATNLIAYSHDSTLRLPGLGSAGAIVFTPRSETLAGQAVCIVRTQATTTFAGLFGDTVIPLLDTGAVELNAVEEERFIGD